MMKCKFTVALAFGIGFAFLWYYFSALLFHMIHLGDGGAFSLLVWVVGASLFFYLHSIVNVNLRKNVPQHARLLSRASTLSFLSAVCVIFMIH
ncbi:MULTISPECIES: hypothetical protein [unclassified Paenibacillus]|uniref:hypothetical protein n=1 Tax=unclassified Paenibacillus TaxID=185978 RepID=UPI0011410FEB|nr:hypothetical protein [Paenibacillus sp. 7541]